MAGPLTWTVDESEGLAVVTVQGLLGPADTSGLRTALLRCLAEQPDALLVDVAAMQLADESSLLLFSAVAQQAAQWPGTPLLLCGLPPLGNGRHDAVPMHATVAEARLAAAAGRADVPSAGDQLLPVAGAVRHARNVVTEACLAWDLPHLVGPASLVVSELVANAMEHAGTMMTWQVTRRDRYVHIAVRDGSSGEPVISPPADLTDRGRGLMLVSTVAVRWGFLPWQDGKVVWATLEV
jgi:hypothetical protein